MRDWNKFFKHCYNILCIIIFSVTFLLGFPQNINTVATDYQALKPIVNSAIDFERKCIRNIELPKNVSLKMSRNYDSQGTIVTVQHYYTPDSQLAPYIEYSITLSDDYRIIEASPNELSLRNYTLKILGILFFLSACSGLILPLPILFLFSLIYEFFGFLRKTIRRIRNRGNLTRKIRRK